MRFRKITAFLTAAACAAVFICPGLENAKVASAQTETLTGLTSWQITEKMTIGWNLGNSLDCSNVSNATTPEQYAMAWGNPAPTKALIETVKEAGFNTIRIPTTWYQHVSYVNNEYVIQEEWLNYVKKFVDYAYDLDMFVILNVHHEDGIINTKYFNDDTYAVASEWLGDVWTQLAKTFAGYDQHLIFEGMNEPRRTENSTVEWGDGTAEDAEYINNLNSVFVSTVRSCDTGYNSERLLMIPAYHASDSTGALNALTIPENGGNIAISVHAYEPYAFTMDAEREKDWPGGTYYDIWYADYGEILTELMANLKTVSESKNAPIIIGEFSASDFNNTGDRARWAADYLGLTEKYGFPCVLWDNNATYDANDTKSQGEKHGYINRSNNKIYANSRPVLEAMMTAVGSKIGNVETDTSTGTDSGSDSGSDTGTTDSFWDSVSIGSDWVELAKYENGEALAQWSGLDITEKLTYINENYKIAVAYDAADKPQVILKGGAPDYTWYSSTADSVEGNIAYYSYETMMNSLTDVTLSDIIGLTVQATVDSNIYGVYAVPTTTTSSTLVGHSLSLAGDIGINFYMQLSDEIAADSSAYVSFSLPNGDTTTVAVSEAEKKTVDGVECYVFSCGVTAKDMDGTVTATLMSGNTAQASYSYSVTQYVEDFSAQSSQYSEQMVALVDSMASYGDYAEAYFAGEALAATEEMSAVTAESLAQYEMFSNGSLPEGISYYGSSLLLDSETTLRHYFYVEDGTDVSSYGFTGNKGKYYYLDIQGIAAHKLAEMTVATVGGYTLTYSPMSYARLVLNLDSTEDSLKSLMRALYLYSEAAQAYQSGGEA